MGNQDPIYLPVLPKIIIIIIIMRSKPTKMLKLHPIDPESEGPSNLHFDSPSDSERGGFPPYKFKNWIRDCCLPISFASSALHLGSRDWLIIPLPTILA